MADKSTKGAGKGKPVSTRKPAASLRQTRARSRLIDAPPLMKGLDHRGCPLDPLASDPENITYTEVVKKLSSRRRITLRTKTNRSTSPESQSNDSSVNPSSLSNAPVSSTQSSSSESSAAPIGSSQSSSSESGAVVVASSQPGPSNSGSDSGYHAGPSSLSGSNSSSSSSPASSSRPPGSASSSSSSGSSSSSNFSSYSSYSSSSSSSPGGPPPGADGDSIVVDGGVPLVDGIPPPPPSPVVDNIPPPPPSPMVDGVPSSPSIIVDVGVPLVDGIPPPPPSPMVDGVPPSPSSDVVNGYVSQASDIATAGTSGSSPHVDHASHVGGFLPGYGFSNRAQNKRQRPNDVSIPSPGAVVDSEEEDDESPALSVETDDAYWDMMFGQEESEEESQEESAMPPPAVPNRSPKVDEDAESDQGARAAHETSPNSYSRSFLKRRRSDEDEGGAPGEAKRRCKPESGLFVKTPPSDQAELNSIPDAALTQIPGLSFPRSPSRGVPGHCSPMVLTPFEAPADFDAEIPGIFGSFKRPRLHYDWYEQYHRLGPDCAKVHGCHVGTYCHECHAKWHEAWGRYFKAAEKREIALEDPERYQRETGEDLRAGYMGSLMEDGDWRSLAPELLPPPGGKLRVHPVRIAKHKLALMKMASEEK